jgi:hypothetical protein
MKESSIIRLWVMYAPLMGKGKRKD